MPSTREDRKCQSSRTQSKLSRAFAPNPCKRSRRRGNKRRETNCLSPGQLAQAVGTTPAVRQNRSHRQRHRPPPHAATTGGAHRQRRTCLRRQEARTGSAGRRHTSRSRTDSPAKMGGAHRQCRLPPHVAEPNGLARDDRWRAPTVPVATTRHAAIRTPPTMGGVRPSRGPPDCPSSAAQQ